MRYGKLPFKVVPLAASQFNLSEGGCRTACSKGAKTRFPLPLRGLVALAVWSAQLYLIALP